jgi:putative acetyltransferase
MIQKVQISEYPSLVSLWESSVKATHDFLLPEDFDFYKALFPTFLENAPLHGFKNESGRITGFIGTDADSLEMLFVAAEEIGKGTGKQLLLYAINNLGITKVDVNQQNTRAVSFYKHFGFETKAISDLDGFGKPYPILHLELGK